MELLRTCDERFSGSESALHPGPCLGWAYWCIPCCVISWLSFQGLEWGVLFFRPGLRGEDSGPLLPFSSVCGLHCTGPTKCETIAMGDCYILVRSGVTWTALLCIVSDASGSFLPQGVARRSYRRPLSPSGSGCCCHGYAGSRFGNGLFVSLELSALVLSLCLFFEKTLLSSWWEGEYVALAHILAVLLLRGSCSSVPRRLPPGLCGGSAGPGFTRACSLSNITAY